jgi:hypothetical protein
MRQSTPRAIYAFPIGELLDAHCAQLGLALATVLAPDAPLAVTLEDAPALSFEVLGARRAHFAPDACVLEYASLAALRDKLHPLFTSADPELFFTHRGPFERVIERVASADRETRRAQHEARIAGLRSAYAPLVVHTADERFLVLERESEPGA